MIELQKLFFMWISLSVVPVRVPLNAGSEWNDSAVHPLLPLPTKLMMLDESGTLVVSGYAIPQSY